MEEATGKGTNKCSKAGTLILLILVECCLLAVAGLSIALAVYRQKLNTSRDSEKQLRENQNPCLTTDCTITAGDMLVRMDLKADPCEDFYQFACGRFSKPENRPPDKEILNAIDSAAEITNQILVSELNSEGNNFHQIPSAAIEKAKNFYRSCMEDKQDDASGRTLLLQLIKGLGSWPVSSDPLSGTWSTNTWNIEDALTAAKFLRSESIIRVYSVEEFEESLITAIEAEGEAGFEVMQNSGEQINYAILLPPKPWLKVELYSDQTVELAYKDYIVNALKLLYGSEKEEALKQWASMIWRVESNIAKISPSQSKLLELYSPANVMNISYISSKVSSLNLRRLLSQELQSSITVEENFEVVVLAEDYLASFDNLVKSFGVNASQVLSTYIVWAAIRDIAPHAGNFFKLAYNSPKTKALGFHGEYKPQWRICLNNTVNAMGFAAGAIYAQATFEETDKNKIESYLKLIRQEFINGLPLATWLQPETREQALLKVNAVSWQVGFPQYLDTAAKLDEYYNDLNVTDDYCSNLIAQLRFEAKRLIARYGQPVDRWRWKSKPTDANAYYNPTGNEIVVLAGILHRPVYDRNFPISLFYGSMGSILGHELVHGFDTEGKNFDAEGNQRNWWDDISAAEYDKRAQCFRDQYGKETFMNLPVNGIETVGENIADCGGIKLAYKSYLEAVGDQADKVDQVLPGLNMTGRQQFFLGYAQLWCVNAKQSYARDVVIQDEHSPGPQRVNVVLRNTPQFAEAFNCPDNSKMKPKESDRCELW